MSHKNEIDKWLHCLHSLNYFSLSFPDRPHVADGLKVAVEKRLQGDVSEKYQQALTYKLEVYVQISNFLPFCVLHLHLWTNNSFRF